MSSGNRELSIAFGVALAVPGVVMLLARTLLAVRGLRAPGTVTSEEIASGTRRVNWSLTIEFTDDQGGPQAMQTIVSNAQGRPRVGEAVTVIYPKGYPDRAKLYDVATYWLPWVVLTLGGGLPLLLAAPR
jgi:hypothetical protein